MKGIYAKIPKLVDAELKWQKGMKFESKTGSKNHLVLDAAAEHGGQNEGARPMEALLSALGSSIGMDIVTVLQNKKRDLLDFKINLHGERFADRPHSLKSVSITFELWGKEVTDADVQWAISLSLAKYCSIAAMLEKTCKIKYQWRIHK
jgi:putative redox protein